MERYNRRTNGYEAQGNIEITRNGCQQRTHRFTMTGCEADGDCAQGRRVTFRTEPCNGAYYELNGRVREVQQNDCDTCGRQNGTYVQNRCDTCNQQNNTYTQNGCDDCNWQNNTYTQQKNTYTKRCTNCGNEQRIVDQAGCDADEVSDIWTECGEKSCGCNRARQGNAFTYENIRREQKNGSLWENWLHGGNNTL